MTCTIGIVAIGRNEGERLVACLDSLQGQADAIVYVDSGSTDNSVAEARARGVTVLELDMRVPFSAARARNEGCAHLMASADSMFDYVQFIDGDCILDGGWITTALDFLTNHPKVAAVCGRNRERFPEASIYNRMADDEWNTPIGEAKATGGIVMLRRTAFDAVNGFDQSLIAGEEPEMCLRLRKLGWKIWRIDAEMTLHDASLLAFTQWWQRAKRSGFVYAEAAAMHGGPPDRHGVRELSRIVVWGILLPIVIFFGSVLISPWFLCLALLWPLQMLRMRLRGQPARLAFFLTLVKFPEAQGALRYGWGRLTNRRSRLIEHK